MSAVAEKKIAASSSSSSSSYSGSGSDRSCILPSCESTPVLAIGDANSKNVATKAEEPVPGLDILQPPQSEASIMGTNDSSIVSKRSVERIYYPEPHFFRHFVKKPKRRAPLINRGYWLRMQAVGHVIRAFLHHGTHKTKVVLNLGCGFDAMPFQMLSLESSSCQNTVFVDVDYPYLMKQKCELVQKTGELWDRLDEPAMSTADEILLRSKQYIALGCDLTNLCKLEQLLSEVLTLPDCTFLFIAEVSMTYMESDAADRLISWAAKFADARFCMLEQWLPWGAEHPFADTMLKHFKKLRSPLKSLGRYPKLSDQERRFEDAKWCTVRARSLWDLWAHKTFLTRSERVKLNRMEPFDEWEEFALYAAHYFLLVADNSRGDSRSFAKLAEHPREAEHSPLLQPSAQVPPSHSKNRPTEQIRTRRSYGALFQADRKTFHHHGGYGEQRRLNSTDCYAVDDSADKPAPAPPKELEARACHTITSIGKNFDCLLVGGRTSPDRALSDCWIYRKGVWERAESLTRPLYRHCATCVTVYKEGKEDEEGVLVFGGRSKDGIATNEWCLWQASTGWIDVQTEGDVLSPRFGANLLSLSAFDQGLLLGGMGEDGIVITECVRWSLGVVNSKLRVRVQKCSNPGLKSVCRFGASLITTPEGPVLVGGIMAHALAPEDYAEIERIIMSANDVSHIPLRGQQGCNGAGSLLVGHAAIWDGEAVAIVGGGAVCFSFGSYANTAIRRIDVNGNTVDSLWRPTNASIEQLPRDGPLVKSLNAPGNAPVSQQQTGRPSIAPIARKRINDAESFRRLVERSMPVILEGLDQGPCTVGWTTDYLKRRVGPDREIVVHKARGQNMDFRRKDFEYTKTSFGDFIDAIADGEPQYLRSLSVGDQSEAADFWHDYREIADDFYIPSELASTINEERGPGSRYHSSVLRISGPVTMWLHYDVMANILCQIRGTKKLILFPPSDILQLDIPAGQSSSSLNVFDEAAWEARPLIDTHPYGATLKPGEILFIPPFWAHAACPTEGTSVAVNVFFRDLDSGYASGRDAYGNRDLKAYEDGRRDVAKMLKRFDKLPSAASRFYLSRLAEELAASTR